MRVAAKIIIIENTCNAFDDGNLGVKCLSHIILTARNAKSPGAILVVGVVVGRLPDNNPLSWTKFGYFRAFKPV